MTEEKVFQYLLIASFTVAIGVYITLLFVNAPYGRHLRKGWGVLIPNRVGWLLMEAPSALVMLVLFILGTAPKTAVLIIFFIGWQAHYVHRAFIYPFMLADGKKRIPLSVAAMGMFFNFGNGYLNGRYLFDISGGYPDDWLSDVRFVLGVILFVFGFVTNRWADEGLRKLRKNGNGSYYIPQGGLYKWISCPNYFGEILEWFGWALATWSWAGLSFAIWTMVNLVPRARAHHSWYHQTFEDYPIQRKALIPGVW
jgi:protein-S-isoprenylcysteine O-methyltransferase Ste14